MNGNDILKTPRVSSWFSLFVCIILCGFTWGVSRKVEEGNRLWKEGKYEEALGRYSEAQIDRPDAPEIPFNMGSSFYRQKRYKEAMEADAKAAQLDKGPLKEKIAYNIGNSLFRQENLPGALESYKKALDIDPNDIDAKYNIEFIQRNLEDKKQNQQQQQKQQQTPKNKPEQKQGEQKQQGESGQGEEKKEGQSGGSSQEKQKSPQQGAQEKGREEELENRSQETLSHEQMSEKDAQRILGSLQSEEKRLPATLENRRGRPSQTEVDKDW